MKPDSATKRGTLPCLAGLVAAGALLLAQPPALGQAVSPGPVKPPVKRTAPRPAAAPSSDYWSVDSSLGSRYDSPRPGSRATERRPTPEVATEINSEFGRLPLQTGPGSIGFASGPSASSGQFRDGRTVPGLNPNTQKESSFVGMSLTVPSSSKGLPVPIPVAPNPWNRNE